MLYINIETKVIPQQNQVDWEYGSYTQHSAQSFPKSAQLHPLSASSAPMPLLKTKAS